MWMSHLTLPNSPCRRRKKPAWTVQCDRSDGISSERKIVQIRPVATAEGTASHGSFAPCGRVVPPLSGTFAPVGAGPAAAPPPGFAPADRQPSHPKPPATAIRHPATVPPSVRATMPSRRGRISRTLLCCDTSDDAHAQALLLRHRLAVQGHAEEPSKMVRHHERSCRSVQLQPIPLPSAVGTNRAGLSRAIMACHVRFRQSSRRTPQTLLLGRAFNQVGNGRNFQVHPGPRGSRRRTPGSPGSGRPRR